jgi:hypothetical protein
MSNSGSLPSASPLYIPSVSKINIFYYLLVFGHLKLSIEPYTPLVHLPDDDKN